MRRIEPLAAATLKMLLLQPQAIPEVVVSRSAWMHGGESMCEVFTGPAKQVYRGKESMPSCTLVHCPGC